MWGCTRMYKWHALGFTRCCTSGLFWTNIVFQILMYIRFQYEIHESLWGPRYRRTVSVEMSVAICLWRLATNVDYRSLSHLFGTSTCCLITQEVQPQILCWSHFTWKHPLLKRVELQYRPSEINGAIDGTHKCIKAPPHTPANYFNRISHYSVDHKMKIWDINIGQPGRVHNDRVFALSSLFDWGQRGVLLPQSTETFEDVNVSLF